MVYIDITSLVYILTLFATINIFGDILEKLQKIDPGLKFLRWKQSNDN